MNKKFILLLLLASSASNKIFSQEIPLNLQDELTLEQLQFIQEQMNQDNILVQEMQQPQVYESTILNEAAIDETFGNKFGYSYFSSLPTNISAIGDLPLPNEYKISLNDQFRVILSGSKEAIFDLQVNLDGSILFPELGSISVAGETFLDVKNKLRNLINQSYIGVELDLSIKNLSAKKISIVGAVNTPGTYLVNPFSTISSALNYSGGITEIGTLRNVKLIRTNGDAFTLDLYDLLIDGDRTNDITIESGDVILVGAASQFVDLRGEVNRPATYEIIEGDNLYDLIRFSLGFTNLANTKNIKVSTLDVSNALINSENTEDLNLVLDSVIAVDIYPYQAKKMSEITVIGAVKQQGLYELNSNETLEDLVEKIEFLNVYPWLAILEQFNEDTFETSSVLFSLSDKNSLWSTKLMENAKIFFLDLNTRSINDCELYIEADETIDELIDEEDTENISICPNKNSLQKINDYLLTINYKENNYKMPVIGRFKLKNLIDLLGLDMVNVDPVATYISPFDGFVVQQDYKALELISSQNHVVSFRSRTDDLISVSIRGAVDYPGSYSLKAGSTITDLYKLVGSFKDESFGDGVILLRESVREKQIKTLERNREILRQRLMASNNQSPYLLQILNTIDGDIDEENLGRVAGDFNPSSSSISSMLLSDEDEIIIPYKNNIINIFGEVLNPISFQFDDISVNEAISRAGGSTQFADLRRVYVIKANGLIVNPGRNVFNKNIKLEPGDTVVVPTKIPTNNELLAILTPVTQILSNLAFSAAAIDNLSQSK